MNVDDLIARAEIQDVLFRYCRAVDRGDVEELRAVYHPGADEHHGSFRGAAEDFAPHIVAKMDSAELLGQHMITNFLIERSGDEARVESYFLAVQPYTTAAGTNELAFIGGRYLDDFARRDGRWLIATRTVVMDFSRESMPGAEWPGHGGYPRPGRRAADPSAGFFSSIR